MSQVQRFEFSEAEAHAVIDRLIALIRGEWEGVLRANGATVVDCALVVPAFVNEGFEYPFPDHYV
ncbi:hypothetical protein [Gemmatimonas sp.]|uniref:hypothetical protein n=1 Tax=Gemmatimonas sp. TaxID=1962908 RepID=UPI00398338B3